MRDDLLLPPLQLGDLPPVGKCVETRGPDGSLRMIDVFPTYGTVTIDEALKDPEFVARYGAGLHEVRS